MLDAEVLTKAVALAAERYTKAPEETASRLAGAKAELAKVEKELGRLVEALVDGGGLATIRAAIKEREARAEALKATVKDLTAIASAPKLDPAKIKAELTKRLTEWERLLLSEPRLARQVLRRVVTGKVTLRPQADGRSYRFHGTAHLGRLLEGVAGVVHQPVCREGGSNPHELALKGF